MSKAEAYPRRASISQLFLRRQDSLKHGANFLRREKFRHPRKRLQQASRGSQIEQAGRKVRKEAPEQQDRRKVGTKEAGGTQDSSIIGSRGEME